MKDNTLVITATHIVFISDMHLGVRQNSTEWAENIQSYVQNFFIPYIKNLKDSLSDNEQLIVMNLGDTFDDRKSIDININNLAIDLFEELASIVPVYIINGNHDLSKRTNKGNTSLRTLDLIPNVTVITEPTLITFKDHAKKNLSKFIAIPYLGSTAEESKYLVEYSGKADYALMHTEIAKMKMDNGMPIVSGANAESFKGKIFAGHIHHRQENHNVIYVGAPYQLTRGDIGNIKGIYCLNLKTNELTFTENTYSPLFQKINIEDFIKLNVTERRELLDNNYTYIVVNENELNKYKKKIDLFNLKDGTNAKSVRPLIIKQKTELAVEADKAYHEMSIEELINNSIDQLEITDDVKDRLKQKSTNYLKAAEEIILQDL